MPRLRLKLGIVDPTPKVRPVDRARRAATWGISLLLHLGALLILGVFLFVDLQDGGGGGGGFGLELLGSADGEATGDLTSLMRVPGAGDPLSIEAEGLEDKVLPVEMMDRPVPDIESLTIRPPTPRTKTQGGSAPIAGDGVTGDDAVRGRVGEGQRLGEGEPSNRPVTGRRGPLKWELLHNGGGTPASEKAVDQGLDWLARHQRSDGAWSLDTEGLCKSFNETCPPVRAMNSDTGATGLALLAFLGAGHTHDEEGRYQHTVSRGLRWLISHQSGDGNFFNGGDGHAALYSQAIACMAVCESLAMTEDKALQKPATKGLNFIIRAQNKTTGGWRYVPGFDADTSVLGWQLFALRSAQFAGFTLPKATISLSRRYIESSATDRRRVTYGYMPGWAPSPSMTAEGLLARQYLGWDKDHPAMVEGVGLVSSSLHADEMGRNIYYWYYATQLLHNIGGPTWDAWNVKMRDTLIAEQMTRAGCARGSWDPTWPEADAWGSRAGRVYQTALSLLTLEVYYRFLPLYRTEDLDLVEGMEKGKDQDAVVEKEKPAAKGP